MVRSLIALAFVLVASTLAAGLTPTPGAAERGGKDYIVVFKESVASPGAVARELGHAHGLGVGHVYKKVLRGFSAQIPDAALGRLKRDPRVDFVEPDDIQFELAADEIWNNVDRIGGDVRREGEPPTEAGLPVAVLDTGIDPTHPDLNVKGGYNCTGGSPHDWGDVVGHGTAVAGVIGAKNNGVGAVGLAPNTELWAVKVFDDQGRTNLGRLICGLEWVAQAGITIANMSFGGPGNNEDPAACDNALHRAICAAANDFGIRLVTVAGNNGGDVYDLRFIPAMYDQVITVSAFGDSDGCEGGRGPNLPDGADDVFAGFSNFGAAVDVAAPGVSVWSTVPALIVPSGYAQASGTSAAAPYVAAAIALGWDGAEEGGAIPGDPVGINEGIVNLSRHTRCQGH